MIAVTFTKGGLDLPHNNSKNTHFTVLWLCQKSVECLMPLLKLPWFYFFFFLLWHLILPWVTILYTWALPYWWPFRNTTRFCKLCTASHNTSQLCMHQTTHFKYHVFFPQVFNMHWDNSKSKCILQNPSDILTTLKSRSRFWNYWLKVRFWSWALRDLHNLHKIWMCLSARTILLLSWGFPTTVKIGQN